MFAICLLSLVLGADPAAGEIKQSQPVWPGFLGAGASPLKPDSLPLAWSPSENIAWKADLPGYGQSSPVVWGDAVFVTSVEGPEKDTYHLVALDLASGAKRWQKSVESTDKVKSSLYISRAAPTPVVDAGGVYAFFESGDVLAVSLDGKERWRRSLATDYGKFQNEFGLGASPVQTESSVIILADHDGPSYLICLAKDDGRTLWKTPRASRRSWSSPALANIGGRQHVVCSSAGSVDGYDPQTGELLWTYGDVGGNTSSTPLAFAEGKFLVGASAGREAERAEKAKDSNLAMQIAFEGDKPVPKVLWRTTEATPTFGSPVVYAGHAYWINRSGVIYCLDAESGEPRYTERIKQSCWATPLGAGDRVYFFGKDGLTTVLRSGPKFEVLAENELWDPSAARSDRAAGQQESSPERRQAAANFSGPMQYGVAAVGRTLLIRTGKVLYCMRAAARP